MIQKFNKKIERKLIIFIKIKLFTVLAKNQTIVWLELIEIIIN